MLLARRVSLSVTTLLDEDAALSLVAGADVKFKLVAGTDRSKLTLTQHLVTQVARAAVEGMRTPVCKVPSAAELRDAILASRSSLGFDELLEYCWSELGIPVLPISTFPPGSVKMDGLATNINGRPVIIISKDSKQEAWLLFILAHELGHIGSGHVGPNQTLVDSDVVKTEAQDPEEEQANAYATSLLRGTGATMVQRRLMTAETLLVRARELGVAQKIDPGHLILSYAREKGAKDKAGRNFWPVANSALKLLSPGSDGPQVMRQKVLQHLDWSAFSDDVAEYIRRMTDLESD